MNNTNFIHKIFSTKTVNKVIVYTAAAMIFTASPALPVSAAETAPPTDSVNVPADIPDSSTSNIDASSAQPPADSTTAPDLPTDTITTTPLPEPTPADQDNFEVTPMQSTVYAATQKGLNVRSGPSTNHGKLGTLKYGQEITVTGKTADNWYQIQYSGSVGYVNADFVSSTPPANSQTPAIQPPSAEAPDPEPPAPAPDPDAEQAPPTVESGAETSSETQTEDDSSEEGGTVVVSNLIGTPVYIILAIAIAGVLALIGYSVYSFFKKDNDMSDEYYEDAYYEDDEYPDDEYYEEDEQDSGEAYYEESEQDLNEEIFESNEYPDEDYYESDEQYSDEDYYENNGQYPDEAYYEENEQDSDESYYENNGRRR